MCVCVLRAYWLMSGEDILRQAEGASKKVQTAGALLYGKILYCVPVCNSVERVGKKEKMRAISH